MSETDSGGSPAWPQTVPEPIAAAVEGVPVSIGPAAAEAMTEAGEGWFAPGNATRAARLVVEAWVTAVNGDDSALRALAELTPPGPEGADDRSAGDDRSAADNHGAAHGLLHPAHKDWVIAPDPEVTGIALRRLDRSREVPELGIEWRFTASQRYGGPVIPPGWMGPGDREYVGSAYLDFDESRTFPWRLTLGHVETVDQYYGYTFTARDETPEEYQARAESAAPLASTGLPPSTGLPVSAAALVPSGTYRLVASFAEHDHKFSGDATADVDSDVPLNRDEAARLAEDAVDAEARQRMTSIYPDQGAGMEVRPSLNALQVIRLVAAAPAVEPAAGPDGAGIDDFARRYAASRGLAYPQERQPAWRDPGPWFLATLNITRSRGLMTGGVGGGQSAEVWYAEGARLGRGGSRDQWIVARYMIMQAHRAGSLAVAVRRKRRLGRPGPPSGLTGIPRGLAPASVGDVRFRLRYAAAAAGGDPFSGEGSWARRLLTDELTAWLLDQPYGDRGAEATCFQLQGGLLCVYAAGWPQTADALDAFRERAARIASAVEQATRYVVQ